LCICWIYDGLFKEFKYAFPKDLVFASKSSRLDKRCRVATFQFHAINKIKLPIEVKGTSIYSSDEGLAKGVAHVNL
jgi:hypothetical protein